MEDKVRRKNKQLGNFSANFFTLYRENYVKKSLNKIKQKSANQNIQLIYMANQFFHQNYSASV